MAKGRVINKSISTSKKVNMGLRNPLDCLLYTWGLLHADDEGRIDGEPEMFRSQVAPALPGLTDKRISEALTAMVKIDLIDHYLVKGGWVIQFKKWDEYQSFHGYHRSPSHFPPPPEKKEITNSGDSTNSGELKHQNPPHNEVKVKESKVNKTNNLPDLPQSGQNRETLSLKPLTPNQIVVEWYKIIKGFDNQPGWDRANFARYSKHAKSILDQIPYYPSALKAIKRIGKYFDKREIKGEQMEWNLSTIVKYIPEFLKEQNA